MLAHAALGTPTGRGNEAELKWQIITRITTIETTDSVKDKEVARVMKAKVATTKTKVSVREINVEIRVKLERVDKKS